MNTKLNAEALASERYMMWSTGEIKGPRAEGYASAIREVAQPIADERDELRQFAERAIKVMERTANDTLDGRNAAIDGRELLAKYPKP